MRLQLALKGLTAVNARVVKRRFYLLNYRNQRGKAQNPIYIRLSDSHRISLNIIIKATGVPEDIMVKLTAPQTFKVVNYLLTNPHTSQIEISRNVEVSRDLVNHVVQELEAPGIVLQEARGHLELKDPLRLLEAISIQRPLSKLVMGEIRTEESEVSKVEKMVRNVAAHSLGGGQDYALTCFSALSKYMEYYITYPAVHVYSSRPEELQKGLVTGRGDVVIQILKPDSDLILENTTRVHDLTLVEPVEVVIDLFCLGGAGRDGAMKLYQSLIQIGDRKKKEKKASVSHSKRVVRRTA